MRSGPLISRQGYFCDGNGNVSALVDLSTQAVLATYGYDSFGKTLHTFESWTEIALLPSSHVLPLLIIAPTVAIFLTYRRIFHSALFVLTILDFAYYINEATIADSMPVMPTASKVLEPDKLLTGVEGAWPFSGSI
jgi:hypothetical protein